MSDAVALGSDGAEHRVRRRAAGGLVGHDVAAAAGGVVAAQHGMVVHGAPGVGAGMEAVHRVLLVERALGVVGFGPYRGLRTSADFNTVAHHKFLSTPLERAVITPNLKVTIDDVAAVRSNGAGPFFIVL